MACATSATSTERRLATVPARQPAGLVEAGAEHHRVEKQRQLGAPEEAEGGLLREEDHGSLAALLEAYQQRALEPLDGLGQANPASIGSLPARSRSRFGSPVARRISRPTNSSAGAARSPADSSVASGSFRWPTRHPGMCSRRLVGPRVCSVRPLQPAATPRRRSAPAGAAKRWRSPIATRRPPCSTQRPMVPTVERSIHSS